MCNYVVIARFANERDTQLKNLQNLLLREGYSVPQWPPHITIAAYENFDEQLLCEWTAEFCSSYTKIKIALNSLSILPPCGEYTETAVLCLDPAHSKPFVDFYYGFHEKYEEYCTGIGALNSIVNHNPVIHATIGVFMIREMQTVMELIFSQNVFGGAEIVALEIYTYPMKLIKRFDLR